MKQRLKIIRANIIGMVVIALGIVVLLNFLSARHYKRFDLTNQGEHTLAEQTIKLLKSLDSPLKVIVFDKLGGQTWVKAEKLLTTYKYYSDKIETSFIDPDKKPALAEQYGVQRYGTLFFEHNKRQEQTAKISEEAFTNIILKLTRVEQKKVYFLSGHGENDLTAETKTGYSLLKEAISKQNYGVETLPLMRKARLPDDCTVLIVSGPEKDLFPEESKAIEKYLQNGGKALFLLDPPPGVGLNDLLSQWGVKVGNDMVIDKLSRLFGGDYFMPVITSYSPHPITHDFKLASFFPVTRSVSPQKTALEGVIVESLARTSQESWAETDYKAQDYEYNPGKDMAGPVSVAVAVEIPPKGKEKPGGRLVVLGDADFANNTYLNLSGNRDLFLNILNWLSGEEALISLRPKDEAPRTINLTQSQMEGVFGLTVVVIPLLFLGIGLLVWFRRRKT